MVCVEFTLIVKGFLCCLCWHSAFPARKAWNQDARWALMSHSIFEGRSYCVDDKSWAQRNQVILPKVITKLESMSGQNWKASALYSRTLCDFLLLLWLVYFLWFVCCSDLQQSKEDKLKAYLCQPPNVSIQPAFPEPKWQMLTLIVLSILLNPPLLFFLMTGNLPLEITL